MDKFTQGIAEISQLSKIPYAYNSRELVFETDKVKLYHYASKKKKPHTKPLLVVFATVNRPEILDLFPERSFIGGLLNSGLDVYLLDWGYPDANDKAIKLEDYAAYLDQCTQFIKENFKTQTIDLLGVCQGGVISLGYAATSSNINQLVLISTPVDFHTDDNLIYKLVKPLDIDTIVALTGNIPGSKLTEFFISLKPFELIGKKYLQYMDKIEDDEWRHTFLRVEKWLHDAPDQTGASFSEFIKDFYQENKLIKSEIYFKNKRIELSKINIPVLNIIAEEDEIIPPSASYALKEYIPSTHYSQMTFPSGHIGIYVSERVGKKMPSEIANWLKSTK